MPKPTGSKPKTKRNVVSQLFHELSIRPRVEYKRDELCFLLRKCAGLFIRGPKSFLAVTKSPALIQYEIDIDEGKKLWILGIAASDADARDFEVEFRQLCSWFKNTLDLRDLNLSVVRDFIFDFLRNNLYDVESEKVIAVEFIIAEADERAAQVRFMVIDSEGNPKAAKSGQPFVFLGCQNPRKRKTISERLKKINLNDLEGEDTQKSIVSIIDQKPFEGEVCLLFLGDKNKGDGKEGERKEGENLKKEEGKTDDPGKSPQ